MSDKPSEDRTGWFDRQENVTLIVRVLYVLCALAILAEVFGRKVETSIESLPGFYGIYGFLGSVVVVLAAKEILRRFVKRPEDYYDD